MKYIILVTALGFTMPVLAQVRVVNVDFNLMPSFQDPIRPNIFPQEKYIRVVQGTPYLNDAWMKSNFVQGVAKTNVLIRLDLLENEVHYLDEAGLELIAVTPISNMLLLDTIKKKQYFFVHSSSFKTDTKIQPGWYHELMAGKVNLYKFYKKQISETLPYGQGTYEQKIHTVPEYYIFKDNELIRVKKINDLPQILFDKEAQLDTYLVSKNFRGKDDFEYLEVLNYYVELKNKK